MTVTKDQAQMLTSLAVACRPNGARRWDSAGVMAALKQVADRGLAEVILATIRAASDRDVDTPGVIPSAGSHWQQAAAVKVRELDVAPVGTRCTICGDPKGHHRLDDHPYTRPTSAASPDALHGVVEALKDEVRHNPAIVPEAKPETPDRCGDHGCVRGHGHTGPHQGPPEVAGEDSENEGAA